MSRAVAALACLAGTAVLTGCASVRQPVPACASPERLALVAQSVPSSAYVPCLQRLPAGWAATGFDASSGHTRFALSSDRAPGHPVRVLLTSGCDLANSTPVTPRGPGVQTSTRLQSISPRYTGTLFDAFAGGCVTYRFDFQRGPHIPLMEEFEAAVTLYPRQQLAAQLYRQFNVRLGP